MLLLNMILLLLLICKLMNFGVINVLLKCWCLIFFVRDLIGIMEWMCEFF